MRPPALYYRSLLLVAALALSPGHTCSAELLVYEGFGYSAAVGSASDLNGDNFPDLNGQGTGMGFAGAWVEKVQPTNENIHRYDYIEAGSVVPPTQWAGLSRSGNSMQSVFSNDDGLASEGSRRLDSDLLDISAGRTLWLSFLVNRDVGNDSGTYEFVLTLSPNDFFDGNTEMLQIGDTRLGTNYALAGYTEASYTPSTKQMVTNEVAFLVVKMVFNPAGNDLFQLFVNPTPNEIPVSPDAELNTVNLSALNYLGFNTVGSSASRQWSLDEIRIGDTYADVTPTIPEPTTAVMSLVGAAALGFRRRWR